MGSAGSRLWGPLRRSPRRAPVAGRTLRRRPRAASPRPRWVRRRRCRTRGTSTPLSGGCARCSPPNSWSRSGSPSRRRRGSRDFRPWTRRSRAVCGTTRTTVPASWWCGPIRTPTCWPRTTAVTTARTTRYSVRSPSGGTPPCCGCPPLDPGPARSLSRWPSTRASGCNTWRSDAPEPTSAVSRPPQPRTSSRILSHCPVLNGDGGSAVQCPADLAAAGRVGRGPARGVLLRGG